MTSSFVNRQASKPAITQQLSQLKYRDYCSISLKSLSIFSFLYFLTRKRSLWVAFFRIPAILKAFLSDCRIHSTVRETHGKSDHSALRMEEIFMIQAAIFGFGNIGSGVAAVLEENCKQVAKAVPGGIHVKYILDIRDFPDSPFADRIVHDIDVILSDPEIKVVCETMGGKEPAFTFSKRALEKGISVCSSNKELVEAFGPELLRIASENHCSYLFEASVGGGIPLLTPLLQNLAQEEIQSVTGILNGTTNYILTKMERYGADYAQVLKEAQDLGYAERNPAADVEGHDTGRKISIISSLISGKTIRFADIYTEGITKITPVDFTWAKANGYSIKLLGRSKKAADPSGDGTAQIEVMTAPFLVKEGHPLYGVCDVFNGVLVHGNMVDDVMFYGRGAGKLPTGSAVVADMILAAKNIGQTVPVEWNPEVLVPVPSGECINAFFVRMNSTDAEKTRTVFADKISAVWSAQDDAEFVFVTCQMQENCFFDLLGKAGEALSVIRVL